MMFTTTKMIASRTATAAACLAVLGSLAMPKVADAATFEIFLISEHDAPSSSTNGMFEVATQTAYRLGGLNNNNKATSIDLVDNFTLDIDTAMTVNSFNNPDPAQPTDPNEPGGMTTAYMNGEAADWENSGISGTTPSPEDQIDFGRNASVLFNAIDGGFTDLIISDLGGINPFALTLCSDATCDPTNSTVTQLFAGFNRGLTNTLAAMADFAVSDDPNDGGQDQTWLFRFDAPITDYVEILEFDNRNVFTGARLQADFVGAGGTVTTPPPPPPPSPIPVPAGLPLLLSGLALAGWVSRKRES